MTTTAKQLISPKYAENSQTTQYTATNCKARIDKFTVSNVTGANETIQANIVNSGGSASDSNIVEILQTIPANTTQTLYGLTGHIVETNGFISTIASATSALTIICSGVEIT